MSGDAALDAYAPANRVLVAGLVVSCYLGATRAGTETARLTIETQPDGGVGSGTAITCHAKGDVAVRIGRFAAPGARVRAAGRLVQTEYLDKRGAVRHRLEMMIDDAHIHPPALGELVEQALPEMPY